MPRACYVAGVSRDKTIATFIAGMIFGGGLMYLSPTQGGGNGAPGGPGAPGVAGAAPTGPGGAPPVPGGVPGGAPGADASGTMPGTAGYTPGTIPGVLPGTIPADAGAESPAPGVPADGAAVAGAAGAGSAEGVDTTSVAPSPGPNTPAVRLEKHLTNAPVIWKNLADKARVSQDPKIKALAKDIEAHIAVIPRIGEFMPPLQEVATYIVASKSLLERCAAAGMDVAELQLQIDGLMRPAHGKVPGGGPPGTGGGPAAQGGAAGGSAGAGAGK